MTYQASSKKPSLDETKIELIINNEGDTLLAIPVSSAKVLLTMILEGEISDSIIKEYQLKDSLKSEYINLNLEKIKQIQKKSDNYEILNHNLNTIIKNLNTEINYLNKVIKDLKRDIRKQKLQKFIFISTTIILPILLILL